MSDVTKQYDRRGLQALADEIDQARAPVQKILGQMANAKPWAAHWLGGDHETGSSEIQPARFRSARNAVREARDQLNEAAHQLVMLSSDTHTEESP